MRLLVGLFGGVQARVAGHGQGLQDPLGALLSGFGYTALIYTKYLDDPTLCDQHDPLCAEMTYPVCVTITMLISTFTLFGAMLMTQMDLRIEVKSRNVAPSA